MMKHDLSHYTAKLTGDKDERAVSPVIGVILMVAITVILAAVIAAFVLDMGDLDDSAPNAQFEWENTTDSSSPGDVEYTVTLTSGDNIDNSSINVGGDAGNSDVDPSNDWGDEATAGDEMVIQNLNSGNKVTITWEGDSSSTILTEYDG